MSTEEKRTKIHNLLLGKRPKSKDVMNAVDELLESRLSELKEKVKGLYNEDDPQDYKDAIFDVLNTMSEIQENE